MCLRTPAKGSRRVDDTCNDLAIVLGGLFFALVIEHVQHIRSMFVWIVLKIKGLSKTTRFRQAALNMFGC